MLKIYFERDAKELKEITRNQKLLDILSKSTEGRQIDASNISDTLTRLNETSSIKKVSIQVSRTSLWDNSYILGLIILCFSLEWYLRKNA